mmetsp:Transcript_3537/g.7568  ORF Transcript_3537/g.7568 Transcript_3537/m.7568 type:complete len:81 (+) Transcript_3537:130-372(+)
MSIKYCTVPSMIADNFTKPLQGHLFQKFWSVVMNINYKVPDTDLAWEQDLPVPNPQECVGNQVTLIRVVRVKLKNRQIYS